mgnify:CR=1 FL=1
MNSNSNSRKSMHRSKSRKANKVASGNDERKEKGSKHLGLEINIVIWEIALAKRARNLIVSTSSINHTFEQNSLFLKDLFVLNHYRAHPIVQSAHSLERA